MYQNESTLVKFLKIIVIVLILFFSGTFVYERFIKVEDVTADMHLSEAELARKYDVSFVENPSMVDKIPQYTKKKTVIQVHSGAGFDVIYADGKQIGVGTKEKRRELYNVKWGNNEVEVNRNLTFPFTGEPMEVVNDMAEGNSTATFYVNESTGEGVVYVRNSGSNLVIYMVYYSNAKKAMETLSALF
ncbi:MAG: hypothetical protein K6G07_06890 [Lachnospiraceae bacterium]|nr:hypothetical protein [Lachnospiraceae bacterium]